MILSTHCTQNYIVSVASTSVDNEILMEEGGIVTNGRTRRIKIRIDKKLYNK